ncbi:MAG: tetratricopeptide repeat protein [Pirellulales bacterium]
MISKHLKLLVPSLLPLLSYFCLSLALPITLTYGQEPSQPSVPLDPVVARVEMKLAASGEAADIIAKGDLLTVLEVRGDRYVIQTFSGRKGIVAKVNALQLAESAPIYSELIEASPTEGRLYTLRASAYWALQDREKALADFDKAIELGYDAPHAFNSRGLFFAATENYAKAIDDFSKAISKDAKDESSFINRAAAYVQLGKLKEAIADYDAAIALRPQNAALYQQRAVSKKVAGQLEAAIDDFSKAIEIEPQSIPALMGRGFVHFQMADHAKAIEDFSKVIELEPTAAVAYNNRGYNLQQLQKEESAATDFEKAIQHAPQYGLAYQNQAWLLATSQNPKIRNPIKAVESARKACELSEYRNVSDLAALAASLAATGEFEQAAEWQKKVVDQADPSQREYANKVLDRYKTRLPFDLELLKQQGIQK